MAKPTPKPETVIRYSFTVAIPDRGELTESDEIVFEFIYSELMDLMVKLHPSALRFEGNWEVVK